MPIITHLLAPVALPGGTALGGTAPGGAADGSLGTTLS